MADKLIERINKNQKEMESLTTNIAQANEVLAKIDLVLKALKLYGGDSTSAQKDFEHGKFEFQDKLDNHKQDLNLLKKETAALRDEFYQDSED